MPDSPPFLAWTMPEMADHVVCEKFEANMFAKSRCQNCFRTVAAHQCGRQEPEKNGVKTPNFVASTDGSISYDPLDPLCILVPQCELYVCLGSEEKTVICKENVEHPQLICRAQEGSEEARTCLDAKTIPWTDAGTNDTLSRDWEMTRILDILRFDREDMMYYAGQKQEVRPENLHSGRPRWSETVSSGRTESWSCLKEGFRAVSQDLGDGKRKQQAESGYFSSEQGKPEPTWASSPPRVGCGTLPTHGESPGIGGRPPSSASSADSDLCWRLSGTSCEGRQGLMRQEYTVLADLPKPKRLNHRQAFEKDHRGPRTQSPGRVEVERIFGPERRKSETLEAFQALEEGLLERLDSKSLKLAKEKRLVRRQSSPTLRRDVNKRFPQDSAQSSRHGGESLRLGRSDQPRERFGRSRGQSLPSGSPPQGLERESRGRGVTLQSSAPLSQHVERERRRAEEAIQNLRVGGERAVLRSKDYRKPTTDGGTQRQLVETSRSKPSGKSPEAKWKSCLNALHAAKPTKYLDEGQGGPRRTLERYKENDRKARGKPLLPVGTTRCPSEDTKDCQDGIRTFNLGRGTATGEKGGRVLSPPRLQEVSWGNQREAKHPISPGREMGISERRHGDAGRVFSPGRCTDESQRQTGHSRSPGRGRGSSEKPSREAGRSPSPGRLMEMDRHVCHSQASCHAVAEQPPQPCWKSHREPAAARRNQGLESNWPPKSEPSHSFVPRRGNDWKLCSQTSCSTHLPATDQRRTGQGHIPCSVRPESGPQTPEGLLCHVHPMQLLEREWLSQGDYLNSVKPGQRPQGESHWRSRASPLGQMKEDERQNEERCPSPRRLENQARRDWNNEEKLSYQHQLDGAKPLKSSCSLRNQDIYLDTSKIQKPDLLNFKKGWMSILEKPGEWTKHWFVLTDSSLRYYRDSNAEEADDLDGEIDLRSCTDVTEFAVQRNYGFQIHTKDAIFTLSAMTSGIRRNWIEALRKSIRPVSVPDVTKLSDCNKENTFRSYGSPRSPFRSEEQRPTAGSEVIPKGGGSSRKADGQRHAFDYVELSPLGSLQRTRGSTRAAEGKREELERDLAVRQEERRKWFESPASGALQTDGPVGEIGPKTGVQDSGGTTLTEIQKHRLSEEIEKKWQELERLPLKDSKRVPLMALLNQGKGGRQDTNEALEKEVQLLRSQLESLSAQKEGKLHKDAQMPRGYISQDACERSLAEMENSHRQVMAELQRHHQQEMERLQQEKHRLLSEEAAATAAAIEALKKAHREELNKELSRTRSFQKGDSDSKTLQQQHQSDVESLKRELQVLSEQYSQKCLQIGDLVQKTEDQEQTLQHCQQEGKELLRQNQELQRRLSEEIGQLRAFITAQSPRDGVSHNKERNSCELEVLLRVKENELQYLKQEVQCLRDELHMMQKDQRFASGKYQDVYVELNHIKRRSEREIEHLKEHLRLAMAALQEKEMLHNSIG